MVLFIDDCNLLCAHSVRSFRALSPDEYGGVALVEETVQPMFDAYCIVSIAAPNGDGIGIEFTVLRLVNDPPSNTFAFVQVFDGNNILSQLHPNSSDLKVGTLLRSSTKAGEPSGLRLSLCVVPRITKPATYC